MIGSRVRRFLRPVTVIATLGSALTLQACSGRVQESPDCRSNSSCGGRDGASGGKAEAGRAAVAGSVGDSGGAGGVTLDACENQAKDANEADVDCGGDSKCARCASNSRCTTNQDCETHFCFAKRCEEPSCTDKVKNQDETGVDCGGSCKPCSIGTPCSSNEDCSDRYCEQGACADHCHSGKRESDETDTDCGGERCGACPDSKRCLVASDCQSLVCSNRSCRPETCDDQIKNQDETDQDCGGVCSASKRCPLDAHCSTAADCESWICSTSGKCLADIVIPTAAVIDDFEDGDLVLPTSPALAGRVGSWYGFDDGTGSSSKEVFAIMRGANSVNGLHLMGQGFTTWGAGVGVDLNNSGTTQTTKAPWDASAYAGVTFWARAQATVTVTVTLPNADTDAAGNSCSTCGHHYSKAVQVSSTWQRFTIDFSELTLEPGGVPTPTAFKPSGLLSVHFRFSAAASYDVYLDDVAFVTN
jgi:hypothetical protein